MGVVEFKKTMFFKTEFLSLLKTIFFYVLQVSDSRTSHDPTRKMCRCRANFHRSSLSSEPLARDS